MKEWLKATAIRTLKTGAEVALGFVTIGAAFSEIDWIYAASVTGVAMLAAILWAIKGLPEVSGGESLFKIEETK